MNVEPLCLGVPFLEFGAQFISQLDVFIPAAKIILLQGIPDQVIEAPRVIKFAVIPVHQSHTKDMRGRSRPRSCHSR